LNPHSPVLQVGMKNLTLAIEPTPRPCRVVTVSVQLPPSTCPSKTDNASTGL
jgi:hypothetical protein